MNSNIFTYSLLRYVHSQSAGETLNVGVLFIFPEQRRLFFHAPNKLSRLTHTYKNFSESLVKAHLKGIKLKVEAISKDWNLFYDDILKDQRAFISKELLLEDATALQFSEIRTGVLDTDNIEEIYALTLSYYELYFRDYEEPETKEKQRNEKYISQKLYSSISARNKSVEQYIKKDFVVESPVLSLKFDGWQNHKLHLVKPLSFDLETEEGIQEKSARNFGYLTLLSEVATQKDYTFDILVTRPTSKRLYSAYDKAIEVLNSAQTSKRIIEEPQFEAYSAQLVREIVKA